MRCQDTYPRTRSHPCFTDDGYVLENGIEDSNTASMKETIVTAYVKYFLEIGVNVNVNVYVSAALSPGE